VNKVENELDDRVVRLIHRTIVNTFQFCLRVEIEIDSLICIDMTMIRAKQFAEISHIPTEYHAILETRFDRS
jgi:hypothetical protein